MNSEEDLFIFSPNFQRKIFEKIAIKFGSSLKASKILGIPASSIRAYKNLKFKRISRKIINKLLQSKILTQKELSTNLLGFENKKEIIQKCLNLGREERKNYFKRLKKEIAPLKEIISDGEINFVKWFYSYRPLLESNLRLLKVREEDGVLILNYNNFAKTKFKEFEVKIPSKFKINDEFSYFFGLWCGDRSGGKRFGIINKENSLIDFSYEFLKKLFQHPSKVLYIKKNEIAPILDYDKKIIIKGNGKGWAISTHSNNGVLASFFYYLLENIEEFFGHLSLNIFFAGLFDAEGNVSLYNKSFRWACKNEKLVKIYSSFLEKLDLYNSYDGSNIIAKNKKSFYEKICPNLKHKEKINNSLFLCTGNGKIPLELKQVLDYLKNTPLKTQCQIAKALKKSKVYSELRLLKEFGFILAEDYPLKFKLNNKNKILGA